MGVQGINVRSFNELDSGVKANFRVNRDLLELRNLVDCAELIVRSASMRHESRGLHYSRDYPFTLPVSFPTVLMRTLRSGKKPKTNGLSA